MSNLGKSRIRFIAVLLLLGSVRLWAPYFIFNQSKPAYDQHSEYSNGKTVAWGPRPAALFLLADPNRTNFTGDEWQFRLFRDYCNKWVKDNGYVLPP